MDQTPGDPPPPEHAGSSNAPTPQPPDRTGMTKRVIAAGGPDLVFLVSSVLFVLASFMPWYRASFGRLSFSDSSWNLGGLGIFAALFGLGAAVVAVLVTTGTWRISAVNAGLLAVVLSSGTMFFTLLQVFMKPGSDVERTTLGLIKLTRGFGLWVALFLAVVMVVAAIRKFRASAGAA